MDTIPTDTVIVGPQDTRGSVDFIVDPTTFNPSAIKQNGKRVLLLKDIGSTQNVDGADAWKTVARQRNRGLKTAVVVLQACQLVKKRSRGHAVRCQSLERYANVGTSWTAG